MAEETYYLWSRFRNGGETRDVAMPNGAIRKSVVSRNTLEPGKKVTAKDLDADEAQWQEYIDSGVVRPYEYPDMSKASSSESPLNFLRRQIRESATSEEEKLSQTVVAARSSDEDLAGAAKVVNK